MLYTKKELEEMGELCSYCEPTEYGEKASCISPNGYECCEGRYCCSAYEEYLDENNTTENIVKYANCVTLKRKEESNNGKI